MKSRILYLLFLGSILIVIVNLFSEEAIINRKLSKFTQGKEEFAVFLSGYISDGKDTVFFDLVPNVKFGIEEGSVDVVRLKTKDYEGSFVRNMLSSNNIPAPRDRKEMKAWTGIGAFFDLSEFDRIVKSGTVHYWGLPDDKEEVKRRLESTYGLEEEEAVKVIKKMY